MPARFPDPLEAELAAILARAPEPRSALVPMMRATARELGWLSDAALEAIAARLGVSAVDADNLAGYFGIRRLPPRSHRVLEVCVNVSCRLRGGKALLEHCRARLAEGSARGVELEEVVCLGACAVGPNVRIDGERREGMTPEKVDALLAGLASPPPPIRT